eukprot:CAMPEP_0182895822 /NCGR_PEP_ID=MMETSP0034_2-20130328/25916_1 /TAXON_ID=156128 /ORGANISM="Nephroselmis pyriformis, Strain CCMP717" /LENGTH=142 /DNA_ID=CAMNT_0025029669 /DNA_START=156 /DNA_END=581 /DNA_ORIENTATION=-
MTAFDRRLHRSPSPEKFKSRFEALRTPSPVAAESDGSYDNGRKHSPWTAPRQRKKQFTRRESTSPKLRRELASPKFFPSSFPIECEGDPSGVECSTPPGPRLRADEFGTPGVDKENFHGDGCEMGSGGSRVRTSIDRRRSVS